MTVQELIKMNEEGALDGVAIEGIPNDVYHDPLCPGFSRSDLSHIARSMKHLEEYKARRILETKKKVSDEFIIGEAVHCLLLEPNKFHDRFCEALIEPKVDKRTSAGKAVYLEWCESVYRSWHSENGHKIALEKDVSDLVAKMAISLKNNETFKSLKRGSNKAELTLFWRSSDGILLKARPDLVNFDLKVCYDHKTTVDATRDSFSKSIARYGYHIQAAMQIDGLRSVFKEQFDFIFGAHEKPCGQIKFYSFDEFNLDVGREEYKRVLGYAKEVQDGLKPSGYSQEIEPIGLPSWAFYVGE